MCPEVLWIVRCWTLSTPWLMWSDSFSMFERRRTSYYYYRASGTFVGSFHGCVSYPTLLLANLFPGSACPKAEPNGGVAVSSDQAWRQNCIFGSHCRSRWYQGITAAPRNDEQEVRKAWQRCHFACCPWMSSVRLHIIHVVFQNGGCRVEVRAGR